MTFLKSYLIIVILVFLSAFSNSNGNLNYFIKWEGSFTKSEKLKIETWLNDVSVAINKTLGHYPFKVNYYIYKSTRNEPVPWANTERSNIQGVHFHVNLSFSLEDFKKDWTAAHEISHLSIPYVGIENMWFSEGYASFMQWKILEEQGVYTAVEIDNIYDKKLKSIRSVYNSSEPFLSICNAQKKLNNYPALYYGGACYFMHIDSELKKINKSLPEIIKLYQNNGRNSDDNLHEVIASLDNISKTKLFSKTKVMFEKKEGIYVMNMLKN